jgi:hypothetical protein
MKLRLFVLVFVCACLAWFGCGGSSDDPKDDTPGKTDAGVALTGADVGSFKLMLFGTGLTNYSTSVQISPAAWNVDLADYGTEIRVAAFIDTDDDNVRDPTEPKSASLFTLTEGIQNNLVMDMEKTIVTVVVDGSTTGYLHPKIILNPSGSGSSSQFVAPIDAGSITLYGDSLAKYGNTAYLSAFEDANDDNVKDSTESLIADIENWTYVATKSATITLY